MAAQTLLILPSLEDGEAILATSSGDSFETRRIASDQIADLDINDPIVILPGQLVRIFETDLPKAGRKQQLQMARFAREDDVAAGSDITHFALSSEQPPHLAIVSKSVMDVLTDTLGGLKPKAAYADYDVLNGDQAVRVIDRAVEPGRAALDLDWTEETLTEPTDSALAGAFSDGLASGRGLNLLQDAYRPKSNVNVPRLPAIRLGALAACALLSLFIWNGVKDKVAATQAKDLRAQTADEYFAVTGIRARANPGRQAAQSVQAGPVQTAGFLDLSNVLFSGLSGMDDIRVDQLRFNAEEGALRLRLIYPDFDGAGRVEAAIGQAGGTLITGGVREQDGAFVGEATLRLESSS